MVTIARDVHHQTVITTFEVMPGVCHDVLDLLRDAYAAYITRQPGFLGAALHVTGLDAAALEAALKRATAGTTSRIEPAESGLEDVFIHLMSRSTDNYAAPR